MIVSELKLFDFFTHVLKLPEAEAKEYVNELKRSDDLLEEKIERKIDKKFDDSWNVLATKEDIANVRLEIEKLRQEFIRIRGEFLLVKWMMGFVLAGILVLILKTFFH